VAVVVVVHGIKTSSCVNLLYFVETATNVEHIPYELEKSDSPEDRKLVLFK
jgi:hypothetical protein